MGRRTRMASGVLSVGFFMAVSAIAATGCGKKGTGGNDELPKGAVPVPSGVVEAPKPQINHAAPELAKSGPLSFAPIAKQADPSVVTIFTIGEEI